MSKCGPVQVQSSRASSDRPIHRPFRVPASNTVCFVHDLLLSR